VTGDGSNDANHVGGASSDGSNGLKVNDVGRTELLTGQLGIPTPVPPVMSNPAVFGMPRESPCSDLFYILVIQFTSGRD